MKVNIGSVLSCNPKMVNGCEEAVVIDIDNQHYEPYSLLFLEYSSKTGYYFKFDTRNQQMLTNAYVDCINPHFCYIKNLYNFLSKYEVILLGYQMIDKTYTSILYLKIKNKYVQIIVPCKNKFYQDSPDNGMFVYIYDADNFDDLKLFDLGDFFCAKYFSRVLIYSLESSIRTGVKFKDSHTESFLCTIQQYDKTLKNKENGFVSRISSFIRCDDLYEFKNYATGLKVGWW